jgi:6-phosphogluconolactonase
MQKLLSICLIMGLVNFSIAQNKSKTNSTEYSFLVGTYSKKNSEGIYYCTYNAITKETKIVSHSPQINDPSFLTISKNQKHIYSVSETDGGSVVALDFDKKSGNFGFINMVNSGGAHPCHIEIDKTGKWLFVANYTGGSVSVLGILADGKVHEPSQMIMNRGSGPNKERQEKPHVHSVNISADNRLLVVADLGTDYLETYNFNSKTGYLTDNQKLILSPGSGPRHFVFHPKLPFAYVIQELTSKITVLSFKNNKLLPIEEVSTLPKNSSDKNFCADIHLSPDGLFLYGSNRYYDKIVTFAVNQKNGKIKQLAQTDVGGKVPRNFAITPDGKFMFVANQDSDNIVVFERNLKTGLLTKTNQEFKISMPVCVKFL